MFERSGNQTPSVDPVDFVEFMVIVGRLKQIPRTGWTRYPIPRPESVADHSFRLTTMALALAPSQNVDPIRSVKMVIVHDLGEWRKGDIVTEDINGDLPNKVNKLVEERDALGHALTLVGGTDYMALYDEFAENETPTAQFANELDKLEMAMQAREYELAHGVDLGEFYVSAQRAISTPGISAILNQVIAYER